MEKGCLQTARFTDISQLMTSPKREATALQGGALAHKENMRSKQVIITVDVPKRPQESIVAGMHSDHAHCHLCAWAVLYSA